MNEEQIRASEEYSKSLKYNYAELDRIIFNSKKAIEIDMFPTDEIAEYERGYLQAFKLAKKDRIVAQKENFHEFLELGNITADKLLTRIEDVVNVVKGQSTPMFTGAIDMTRQLYAMWFVGVLKVENWEQIVRFNLIAQKVEAGGMTYAMELFDPSEVITIYPHLAESIEEYNKIYANGISEKR